MATERASSPLDTTPEEALRILEERRSAYLRELSQSTPEQLIGMTQWAMYEQDQDRPFNEFGTEADYQHYGRCAFLTVSEAVTLSMGKDPRFVNWPMVQQYLGTSAFAFQYASRLDLVERAVAWGELPNQFSPLVFLTWAHKYKVPVPDAFVHNTFARGEPIQYWHDLCAAFAEELNATKAELEATRESLAALRDEHCRQTQQTFDEWIDSQDEIDRLQAEHEQNLAFLQDALALANDRNAALIEQINAKGVEPAQDAALGATERNSLLTIVIAAAIDAYRYDPKCDRNPATKEIADAAVLLGLKMTDETVLKYLKIALKLKGLSLSSIPRRKTKSAKPIPKSA